MIGSTTYGPGTRTTATDVGPIPQGVNMAGIYDLFRRMTAARSAAAAPATGPRPIGGVNAASGSRLNRPASVVSPPRDPLAALKAEAEAQRLAQPYGPTPGQFGRLMMNQTGNWGTFVDPADIPAGLQGTIMGGMYGQGTNWDTTNPNIMGPQQLSTGKYTKNASGAGSGGPMRLDIGEGGERPKPAYGEGSL